MINNHSQLAISVTDSYSLADIQNKPTLGGRHGRYKEKQQHRLIS